MCPTEACSILVKLAASEIAIHAAVTKSPKFCEYVLVGNGVLDALKPILDFHSRLTQHLDHKSGFKCPGSSNNWSLPMISFKRKLIFHRD